jgi:hypothetical protein
VFSQSWRVRPSGSRWLGDSLAVFEPVHRPALVIRRRPGGIEVGHAIGRSPDVLRREWTFLDCPGAGIGFAEDLAYAQTNAGERGEIRRRPMIASQRLPVNAAPLKIREESARERPPGIERGVA